MSDTANTANTANTVSAEEIVDQTYADVVSIYFANADTIQFGEDPPANVGPPYGVTVGNFSYVWKTDGEPTENGEISVADTVVFPGPSAPYDSADAPPNTSFVEVDGLNQPAVVTVGRAQTLDGAFIVPQVTSVEYTPPYGANSVTVAAKTYTTELVREQDLRIAHQYDLSYPTRAALLNGIFNNQVGRNQRVLIQKDENYYDFWTIWRYDTEDETADANGLILETIQTYRTSDFFDVVDWYATGYSATQPPLARYATLNARNIGEGPNPPANRLCLIDNDGSDRWIWTLYDGAGWSVVARQGSTIQFKDWFWDANRAIFAVDSVNTADIPNRDGAWELRTIFNTLRTKILANDQLNELFFSMLHFFHSQQDQIDWAFKTSFMTVVGFNEHLQQTPIQAYDTTQNLLDYVDEVKPYRVKVRDLRRVLTPDVDQATVHATDFDKPLYFDARTGKYRRLDPTNTDDLSFMTDNAPWSDWRENFEKTDHDDPASRLWNPVRNIRIKLLFDRIDADEATLLNSGGGWDIPPWDVIGWDGDETNEETAGSAYARIRAYYQPGPGMPLADDLGELMRGMDFRGTITDAQDNLILKDDGSEWDVRGYDTEPTDTIIPLARDNEIDGLQGSLTGQGAVQVVMNDNDDFFGLRDPYHEAKHPEELIPVQANETISFTVHTERTTGAPNHYVAHLPTLRSRRAVVEIPYKGLASTRDSVLVFRGGLRLKEVDDYTLDISQAVVTTTLPRPRPEYVMVHALGLGGTGRIIEYATFVGDGTRTVFPLQQPVVGLIDAMIDGRTVVPVITDSHTVTLSDVAPAGALVVLVSYENAASRPTVANREFLVRNDAQQWTLTNRTLADAGYEHLGTIIDVNGRRLLPPYATRALIIANQQYTNLIDQTDAPVSLDASRVTVTFDGRETAFTEADPLHFVGGDVEPGVYLVGGDIFSKGDEFVGKILTAVYRDDRTEYTVNDGVLTIYKALADADQISSTTFANAEVMGVETFRFDGTARGTYTVPAHMGSEDLCLVSVNGLYLTCGIDFAITDFKDIGWDVPKYDRLNWGGEKMSYTQFSTLQIPGGQTREDQIVVTIFRGKPADEPSTWGMLSAKPSLSMMGDPKYGSDWGRVGFDIFAGESSTQWRDISPLGERPVFRMTDTWEIFQWGETDPYAGEPLAIHLARDLGTDDDQIVLTVPLDEASDDVRIAIPDPESKAPGVIWIDGERIEYFALAYTDPTTVVLTELRRGTRATRDSAEHRAVAVFTCDGSVSTFLLPGGTGEVPEVRVTDATGVRRHLLWQTDFTISPGTDGLSVTLLKPPVGDLYIGQTLPPALSNPKHHPRYHSAGRVVRNVTRPIQDPQRCPFRMRADYTITYGPPVDPNDVPLPPLPNCFKQEI